ncbi:MAG: hypothetical protein ATN33_01265 [Epulopiscium sp. Nele67-Bin001]|nr:MAG: hypothetical protein BEN18_08130 [Epulopiscium sp. Nuni2H_MBin001]OON91394.1 MAG: hypothetical protein ATN33_01265 [Epulopiscium sp. Nele67-Bin001]
MKKPIATITMQDERTMVFELYPEHAPNTVNNFAQLANSSFYDGLPFHRIRKDWVLQGGSTDGTCLSPTEFSIKGEFSLNGVDNPIKHVKGVLSMARYDHTDSQAVQFFIVHKEVADTLDGNYSAFGSIVAGQDLLEELAHVPTDETDGKFNPPLTPVIIKSIRVEANDYVLQFPQRIVPAVSKKYTGNAK